MIAGSDRVVQRDSGDRPGLVVLTSSGGSGAAGGGGRR
jgi:hypothetical protein